MEENNYEAEVTMEVNDEIADLIRETFNVEVEMLRGSIEKLPNGQTKYSFEVAGQKAEMIKEFILKVISKSHQQNLS